MQKMDLKIDPELRELLPPLTDEERERLKANLISDGRALEPLIVWQLEGRQVLVDGHTRYEICTEFNLPFQVQPHTWESKAAVIAWIIEHQAGRRNLTKHQLSMLRAAVFEAEKNGDTQEGDAEISPSKTLVAQNGQPDNGAQKSKHEAEKAAAKKTGSSRTTIQRDVEYKAAFKGLANDIQRAIDGKEIKANKKEVIALAQLQIGDQRKAVKAVKAGEAKSIKEALNGKPEAKAEPARGQPTVDKRKFDEFESAIGKLVRQNTALKEHAGGPQFHERIRKHFNGALEALAEWKEAALK